MIHLNQIKYLLHFAAAIYTIFFLLSGNIKKNQQKLKAKQLILALRISISFHKSEDEYLKELLYITDFQVMIWCFEKKRKK